MLWVVVGVWRRSSASLQMRAVAREEGRVKKKLAQFVDGKDWKMDGLQLPKIYEYHGSLFVARPVAVTDLVEPLTQNVFFVGKFDPSESVDSIWIAREFLQLLLYGNTTMSGATWKVAESLRKDAASNISFDKDIVTASVCPGASPTRTCFSLDRPTIVVVRCALQLSGRCRYVTMYRLPLVLAMMHHATNSVRPSVKERVAKRCALLVEWMYNVRDALTCTLAKELPAAPNALMDEICHQGVTAKEKVESLRALASPPLASVPEHKFLMHLVLHEASMNDADRGKLRAIPWYETFKQEYEERKRFRDMSREEQIAVVIASLSENPVVKIVDEKTNERVQMDSNGQTVRFKFLHFRNAAIISCLDAILPEYEELVKVYPEFQNTLNNWRFERLSNEIGHEQALQFHIDALVKAFPSATYIGGPCNGSTVTVVLNSADGLKTASKENDAQHLVYHLQRANWFPTVKLRCNFKKISDKDTEKEVIKKFIATHAQKQRLLLIPWFKFDLESRARQHNLEVDTAVDADHQYLLDDGVKLRTSKLAALLSRVDWKITLSASQQYMVFFGNHAEVWSRFDSQYGKGLKEKLIRFLKNEPAGRKLALQIAQSLEMSVDEMWSTHEIDHIWVQANRGDVADCVGNFAMCPRKLNNSDEFKHDGCEKHHYYGRTTWTQVQMLFQYHDKWINTPSKQPQQFNPNKLLNNIDYINKLPKLPTHEPTQTKLLDFFAPRTRP